MKIAVASEGSMVSGHFGHCEGFTIYDINEKNITNKHFVENPGHTPGFLPVFLKDLDVNVIISGGMGGRAQQLFHEKDIDVIVGASGQTDEVVHAFIQGQLQSTGSICQQHAHHGPHCDH